MCIVESYCTIRNIKSTNWIYEVSLRLKHETPSNILFVFARGNKKSAKLILFRFCRTEWMERTNSSRSKWKERDD